MDNKSLRQIKYDVTTLPELKERLTVLDYDNQQAEKKAAAYHKDYEEEFQDVLALSEGSIKTAFLKITGQYDEAYCKEHEECMEAKTEFQTAFGLLKQLNRERKDTEEKKTAIKKAKEAFDLILGQRREAVLQNGDEDTKTMLQTIEKQLEVFVKQAEDNKKALMIATELKDTADMALDSLREAERWANNDIWVGNDGASANVRKYNSIERASDSVGILNILLNDLNEILYDSQADFDFRFVPISKFEKNADVFFDNTYSDVRVRSVINVNQDNFGDLVIDIRPVIDMLIDRRPKLKQEIAKLRDAWEELLIDAFEDQERLVSF
ncbi:MAG: hypothetical protein BGN88_14505 [Clostridiales bacterium 43-6]|nr:MAG: hypothetical protein BGN88_14505 [Clostridiales bacterium 43-6]